MCPIGPRFFDPPIEIAGEGEIEKRTWIRGARHVRIDSEETVIRWPCGRDLVVPRLRIAGKEKVRTIIGMPEMTITLDRPFFADVLQYTDGRKVGGIQIIKRHPKRLPEPEDKEFRLWVKVMDEDNHQGIPEAKVSLFTWNAKAKEFVRQKPSPWFTNQEGVGDAVGLPSSGKSEVVVEIASREIERWQFLPLPGQQVRHFVRLHPSRAPA